jgi:hypothetical protein
MEPETGLEMKFKRELETFFRLTIVNVGIAGITFGLGIGLALNLIESIFSGDLQLLPILYTALGVGIFTAGFYWLINTVEVMDGVSDLKAAYEGTKEDRREETITGLIIEMMAYYRSNRTIISRMSTLTPAAGTLAAIGGGIATLASAASIVSDGAALENIVPLLGGIALLGVGAASVFVARYFTRYSRSWDARLKEAEEIEDALQKKLEAD